MAKKVSKKVAEKAPVTSKPVSKAVFPPKFSTRGVRIVGFTVQVWDHNSPVFEGEDRC